MIEDCRLKIEYLRSAFDGSNIRKQCKKSRAKRHPQIFNLDKLVKSQFFRFNVIPAKAGIQ